MRVQRNTVGALGVDGQEAAEGLPDTRRLEGLLLYGRGSVSGCISCIGFHDLRGNSEVGLLSRRPRRGIGLRELFLCRTLAMLTTLLAALAAWDDMMASGRLMKAVVEVRVMESFPSCNGVVIIGWSSWFIRGSTEERWLPCTSKSVLHIDEAIRIGLNKIFNFIVANYKDLMTD